MNIVEIKNLRKSFKNVVAVDGINLSIKDKDIHGILGPNGAGKSTTINCILGLLKEDEGEVIFEEQYHLNKWKKNIGYVPQDLALYDELTVYENVSFFCSLYGFKKDELEKNVNDALAFTELKEFKNKKVQTLSGGQKRRLNIACGIAHKPRLIIMDEPTVGIDPQSRNLILSNIKELNENGASIIYTTHYMPEVEEICNAITVIDHGKIIAHGTKADIISMIDKKIKTIFEFNKELSEDDIAKLKEAFPDMAISINSNVLTIKHKENTNVINKVINLFEGKYEINNINKEEPTLEEVFLDLTGKELRDR